MSFTVHTVLLTSLIMLITFILIMRVSKTPLQNHVIISLISVPKLITDVILASPSTYNVIEFVEQCILLGVFSFL